MRLRKNNYLKYFKVIRRYIMAKYNVTPAELDVLLYIYSESYFTVKTFMKISKTLKWDSDRLFKLIRAGWVEKFRNASPGRPARYQITMKGSRLVTELYNILEGDKEIRQNKRANPMYSGEQNSDRFYIKLLEDMVEDTKRLKELAIQQQQRLPHE
jgi:DNA-binding MarR family transcriptional regulator